MRGSISISKKNASYASLLLAVAWVALAGTATPTAALADDGSAGAGGHSKTYAPEEDDFSGSPFTEYGEFNEDKDEEADAKFFAHGRFFGVSAGLGYQGVTGNRGLLYQGGFPMADFKLHYWFDFNFALDLGLYFASHFYEVTPEKGGHMDIAFIHVGMDGKYYFDTKNLSAAVSFANPFISIGFGSYTQTARSAALDKTLTPDTSLGLKFGAGLEFALSPKKAYLQFEAKYHLVNFKDTSSSTFQPQIPDLTGAFYTFQSNVLFTW
jgi:hypothetical protein